MNYSAERYIEIKTALDEEIKRLTALRDAAIDDVDRAWIDQLIADLVARRCRLTPLCNLVVELDADSLADIHEVFLSLTSIRSV